MRKILAVSAVALLAFAGQAVASEGVGAFAPVGQVDYRVGGDTDAADGGATGSGGFLGLDTITALALLGGVIAVVALVVTQDDHGKSG